MTGTSRRDFLQGGLALVGLSLSASCGLLPGARRSNIPRIGYLNLKTDQGLRNYETFRGGLVDLGYEDGQNVRIEQRWADTADQFPALATELVNLPVEVILAAGTLPVQAAVALTRTIPIVFPIVGDPVQLGFVVSLARPGGNVTGLSDQAVVLNRKRLEVIRQLVPGVTRVLALADTSIADLLGPGQREGDLAVAESLGIQLVRPSLRDVSDYPAVFQMALAERIEAISANGSPVVSGAVARIVEFARDSRLPLVSQNRPFPAAGGLASYGPKTDALHYRAAGYVDRILEGANPAEMPVEQSSEFEFVINLSTATALGLAVPPSVLSQATEVIQ